MRRWAKYRFVWILEPAALFTAFSALYLTSLTRAYFFDAVSYAMRLKSFLYTGKQNALLHPHHLAHLPLGWLTHTILHKLGIMTDVLTSLQVLSALSGAAGLMLFRTLLRGTGIRGIWLTALVLLLGASQAYWFVSVDGLPYAPAMVGFMLSLLAIQRFNRCPSWINALLIGSAVGLTGLLHQSHLLLMIGALTAIALHKRRLPHLFYLGAGFFVTFLGVYGAVAYTALSIHSPHELYLWSSQYPRLGWWWDFDIIHNLLTDFRAVSKAFITDPNPNLIRPGFDNLAVWFVVISTLAITGIVGLFTIFVTGIKRPGKDSRLVTTIITISYIGFFTIWCPGMQVFWSPIIALVILMLAESVACIGNVAKPIHILPLITAGALLVSNTIWGTIPRMQEERNPYLRTAQLLKEKSSKGDLVIVAGTGDNAQAEVYVPYFTDRRTVSLNTYLSRAHGVQPGLDRIRREIETTLHRGNTVYVFGDLFGCRPACIPLERRYGITASQINDFFSQFTDAEKPKPSERVIYALRPTHTDQH